LLFVPKAIELDGDIPMENKQSKWMALKEKKLAFSKSEADMKDVKIFGEDSEESEEKVAVKGEPVDMEV